MMLFTLVAWISSLPCDLVFYECPRGVSREADAVETIVLERASGDSVSGSILPVKWKSGTQG